MIPLRRAYREPPQGLQVLDHRSPFANACLFAVCCSAGMLPPDVVSMRRPTLSGSSIKDWVRQGGRGLDFQASTGLSYAIPGVFSRQELTLLAWMARTGSRAGYMAALRLERSANDSLGLFQLGRSSSHAPQAWIGGSSGYTSVTGTTTIGADVPFLAGATFDGSTIKVQHNAKQEGSSAAARTLSGLDFIRLSRAAEPAHATIFMAAVLEGVFQDDDQLAFLEAPFNLFRPYAPVFHSFSVPARDVALDANLAATSAAAADLAIARALNGSASSQSTTASALAVDRGLAASLAASAALSGNRNAPSAECACFAEAMMIEVLDPAPTHDLTMVDTVKRELGVTGAEHDAVLANLIRQASRTAASWCNRVFARETVRETLRPEIPFRRLTLDRHPVASVTSVVEDGETLTASDYELDAQSGLLIRLVGDVSTDWCADKIAITYVAGYELLTNLPEDIEKAVIALVRGWWFGRARDPLVKSQDVPGVMRQDYWVGAVGDGGLPPEFETLLAPYRNVVVA